MYGYMYDTLAAGLGKGSRGVRVLCQIETKDLYHTRLG